MRLAWIDMAKMAMNLSFLKHLRGNVIATTLFIRAEEEDRDETGVIPQSSRYDLDTATVSLKFPSHTRARLLTVHSGTKT